MMKSKPASSVPTWSLYQFLPRASCLQFLSRPLDFSYRPRPESYQMKHTLYYSRCFWSCCFITAIKPQLKHWLKTTPREWLPQVSTQNHDSYGPKEPDLHPELAAELALWSTWFYRHGDPGGLIMKAVCDRLGDLHGVTEKPLCDNEA